ncbi:MAG: hypothetical protein ACI8UO_003509 [Verrucomicrobiales bacterium]|jgi:hypothetical protein
MSSSLGDLMEALEPPVPEKLGTLNPEPEAAAFRKFRQLIEKGPALLRKRAEASAFDRNEIAQSVEAALRGWEEVLISDWRKREAAGFAVAAKAVTEFDALRVALMDSCFARGCRMERFPIAAFDEVEGEGRIIEVDLIWSVGGAESGEPFEWAIYPQLSMDERFRQGMDRAGTWAVEVAREEEPTARDSGRALVVLDAGDDLPLSGASASGAFAHALRQAILRRKTDPRQLILAEVTETGEWIAVDRLVEKIAAAADCERVTSVRYAGAEAVRQPESGLDLRRIAYA